MSPLLSVVVPFYNVEPYLRACLESLERQTLRELEVVMVDDGSADGSAAIAKEFAERDGRFTLVQQANQGLGPARNTGVTPCTGKYLAFVDSDDIIPRYAYDLMVTSLEETGSDIACGGVRRITFAGPRASAMHTAMFKVTEKRTHVTRRHDLLNDRTAWNKVFRRAFWDEHAFAFPPGLYEDAPVTLPAHFLASSVDVLADPVYYWREREGEQLSITQRRTEPGNLEDRIRSIGAVSDFLRDRDPLLWNQYMAGALASELPLYVDVAGEGGPEYRRRLRPLVNEALGRADDKALADISALKRLKYHLLRHDMLDELLEVLNFQQARIFTADVVLRGERWYGVYPYFGDASRGIPDRVYDLTDELLLQARVDTFDWQDGKLRIDGHAYITRVPMAEPEAGTIRLWLQHTRHGTRVELPSRRVYRPDVSALSKRVAANYDWSGFTVEVDPADLRASRFKVLRAWRSAVWELHAEVMVAGELCRSGPLRGPRRSDMRWTTARTVAKDVSVRPVTGAGDRFSVQIKPIVAQVTGGRATASGLELDGRLRDVRSTGAELVLKRSHGMTEIGLPVQVSATGEFTARIPIDVLVSHTALSPGSATAWISDGIDWALWLRRADGGTNRLTVRDDVEVRQVVGDGEAVLSRTRYGNLRLVQRARRPVVTAARWDGEGRLTLSGTIAGHPTPDRPDRLIVRQRGSGDHHEVPLTWTDDGFTAVLEPTRTPRFGQELPMASSQWGFFAPMSDGMAHGTADGEVAVALSRSAVAGLPPKHTVGIHTFQLSLYQGEGLLLTVEPTLAPEEAGVYGLKRIQQQDYPAFRSAPLRDLAVFESFRGRQYSDSPRAVYEELQARRPDLEYVWLTRDGQFAPPEGVRTVLYGSRAHFETLAQARFLVGNDPLPEWFAKREGQFYLQTWHGTPLKRIGYDIERPAFKNAQDYLRRFSADVAQWDALVSPNPFSSPIMRQAFRFDGELLEVGYPRNDMLAKTGSPQAHERADVARSILGIPAGKRIVLYAPTWRDDQARTGGYWMDLRIDLDEARRALGDDVVLLIRGHFNVGEGVRGADGRRVLDVSRYPDITDLYLIADVLVTDYSSVMFDFAVTGRPILFFTYDLERYRDELRGFYFDLEAEAPGPLCRTSPELIEAIARTDQVTGAYATRYTAFTEKFCRWDDGNAASRVVDRLLASG